MQSQAPDSLYTDSAEGTELFRHSTEKTVLSVCSVYKKMGLSSDFATAILPRTALRVCKLDPQIWKGSFLTPQSIMGACLYNAYRLPY